MRYSQTTGSFYPDNINYQALPEDIIIVTQADFNRAMARAPGETIALVNGIIVIFAKPEPDLDTLKQIKIDELVIACQSEMDGGFITASGIKMDSNLAALQKIKLGYDFALIIGETAMSVVDFDNVEHAGLPINDVLTLMLETGGHYRDLYMKKQTLRSQAMAAANTTELNLITWS